MLPHTPADMLLMMRCKQGTKLDRRIAIFWHIASPMYVEVSALVRPSLPSYGDHMYVALPHRT